MARKRINRSEKEPETMYGGKRKSIGMLRRGLGTVIGAGVGHHIYPSVHPLILAGVGHDIAANIKLKML